MNKFIKKIILTLALVVMGAGGAFSAQAGTSIDVNYGDGFPISEKNIAPGKVFTRQFTVVKHTTSSQILMIKFDQTGGALLNDKMFVQIRKPDGTLAIMPNGTNQQILKELYNLEEAFQFDIFSGNADSSKEYTLIFTFDSSAGNDYQNKETIFNLSVGIDALVVKETGNKNKRSGGGKSRGTIVSTVSDFLTRISTPSGENNSAEEAEVVEEQTKKEDVKGAGIEENGGEVAGAETCHSWPLWNWIVALIGFAGLSLLNNKKYTLVNFKKHFTLQAVMVIVLLIAWYFWDECRYYKWFPLATVIGGILNQLYSQNKHRKKNV